MIIKPIAPVCGELYDNGTFLFPVRVYYEDTDAGGIVYYANYLKFAERARTEFVRCLGVSQQNALENDDKFAFVVRHCEIDYISPAFLDDELVVSCRVIATRGVGVEMQQNIMRGEKLLVSIEIKVAYVSLKTKRPSRIPKDLLQKIQVI